MSEERLSVPCPHATCEGILRLWPTLPEGEYRCVCGICRLHLTWTTFLSPPRRTPSARCLCPHGAPAPPAGEARC